jgi:ferredoxin
MTPKNSSNKMTPLTQEWMSERRSFLKYMIILTAGALASCLPDIIKPEDIDIPKTIQGTTKYPTSTSIATSTPQEILSTPPTQIKETTAPTEIIELPADYSCGPAATGGGHIITDLCLRDRGCIDVCPVDCIVVGFPIIEWPRVYIDRNTCIDCGACVPECPYAAIFLAVEVPSEYSAMGGEYVNRLGLTGHFELVNHYGKPISLDTVYQLKQGDVVDLTQDSGCNDTFFASGPGYSARDQDDGS